MRSAYNISFFLEDSAKASILDKHNSINKIGHAIHDLDLLFRKFSYRKEYKQILSDLGYKSPQIVQSMYIMKPPYIGGLVNPHQDNAFLITNPNSCIGIWVALEDSSEDNGAMFAVPQSHKLGTKKLKEKWFFLMTKALKQTILCVFLQKLELLFCCMGTLFIEAIQINRISPDMLILFIL